MRIDQLPQDYDAIVIGAGPAGAVSALRLARGGWRVLLLERSAWPREKVCGGCVNADAISMLRSLGIALPRCRPLDRCVFHANERSVSVTVPAGIAIDRATFDRMLVDAAVDGGCTFVASVSATVSETSNEVAHVHTSRREVEVTQGQSRRRLAARWVLACDGINGSSLARLPWSKWTVASQSHIGVAATLSGGEMDLPVGEIHMYIGAAGYVGCVRQADGSIHLAAALDPATCRRGRSPGSLAEEILGKCSNVDLSSHRWAGTGKLTRRRQRLGDEHVLIVGDACGYVEPFTGQGIAWAIESAIEATSMLSTADPSTLSLADRWESLHRRTVRRHQWACHALRHLLRRPTMLTVAMQALNAWPTMPAVPRWIISPRVATA